MVSFICTSASASSVAALTYPLFADFAETVLAAWNNLGWKLKAVDDVRAVEGLEGYTSIGVSKMGDGASVTSWRD